MEDFAGVGHCILRVERWRKLVFAVHIDCLTFTIFSARDLDIKNPSPLREKDFGKSCISSDRLLHSQHVTSLLDTVRDATLMLGGKPRVFSRKDFTRLSDETRK